MLNYDDPDLVKLCLNGILLMLQFGHQIKEMNGIRENIVRAEIEMNNDFALILRHQYSSFKGIYDLVDEILHNYFEDDETPDETF